jgi:hypothetical protein
VSESKKPDSTSGKKTLPEKVGTADAVEASKSSVPAKASIGSKSADADKTTNSTASQATKLNTQSVENAGAVANAAPTKPDTEMVEPEKPNGSSKEADSNPDAKKTLDSSTVPKPSEKEPETIAATQEPVVAMKIKSGFVQLVLGGITAAALGFFASEANFLGWRTQDDSLRIALSTQRDEINALKASQRPPDLSAIESTLGTLTNQLSALDTRIAEVDIRISEVEMRPVAAAPVSETGEAVDAVRAEFTALQTALEEQRDEISGLLGNAKSVEETTAMAVRTAQSQRALAEMTYAINNGGAYADAVDQMAAAGITDLPAALTGPASEGVVTLINLQTRYPDVARAALSDASASTADADDSGFSGFLRRQLGARSVTPREGNSLDAVLSRVEAAVRDGKLSEALTEIDALPDGTKNVMQDWLTDARARAYAEVAVKDLSQHLTAN